MREIRMLRSTIGRLVADFKPRELERLFAATGSGVWTIKGEKEEEKEVKKENHHLKERHFRRFERSLCIPDSIALRRLGRFPRRALTVAAPKTPESQKSVKKIELTSSCVAGLLLEAVAVFCIFPPRLVAASR